MHAELDEMDDVTHMQRIFQRKEIYTWRMVLGKEEKKGELPPRPLVASRAGGTGANKTLAAAPLPPASPLPSCRPSRLPASYVAFEECGEEVSSLIPSGSVRVRPPEPPRGPRHCERPPVVAELAGL
jgi:hypothetical protein